MVRNVSVWLLVLTVLAPCGFAEDTSRDAAPKNIILVGWDGAQRNHLKDCLEKGQLPTLKKLSDQGALVDIDVVTGATDTKAGWTQILTGYDPKITGVRSNRQYQDVPAGYSVFERLKKHFGADSFICVAVIGKSAHCGEIKAPFKRRLGAKARAKGAKAREGAKTRKAGAKKRKKKPAGTIVTEDGVKYLVFKGSPYHTMHKSCDVWKYALKLDEKVGTLALKMLEKYKDKPFFFFVHFAEVDSNGHRHGENSKAYNDALISNDTWTGKIVDKLKALGLYDKTLVYVTADHGFDEGAKKHSYAPYVFLGTNDPKVKRAGMRQDVAPTILARFGLDLGEIDPKLSGESLTADATKPVLKAPARKPGGKRKTGAKRKADPKKQPEDQDQPDMKKKAA